MNRDLTKLHTEIVDMKQSVRKQGDKCLLKLTNTMQIKVADTTHDGQVLASLMEQRGQLKLQVYDVVLHGIGIATTNL